MDWQQTLKIIGAIGAIAAAFTGGNAIGNGRGYDQRSQEIREALHRAQCKIADLKEPAENCGWTRPEHWCELAEEQ